MEDILQMKTSCLKGLDLVSFDSGMIHSDDAITEGTLRKTKMIASELTDAQRAEKMLHRKIASEKEVLTLIDSKLQELKANYLNEKRLARRMSEKVQKANSNVFFSFLTRQLHEERLEQLTRMNDDSISLKNKGTPSATSSRPIPPLFILDNSRFIEAARIVPFPLKEDDFLTTKLSTDTKVTKTKCHTYTRENCTLDKKLSRLSRVNTRLRQKIGELYEVVAEQHGCSKEFGDHLLATIENFDLEVDRLKTVLPGTGENVPAETLADWTQEVIDTFRDMVDNFSALVQELTELETDKVDLEAENTFFGDKVKLLGLQKGDVENERTTLEERLKSLEYQLRALLRELHSKKASNVDLGSASRKVAIKKMATQLACHDTERKCLAEETCLVLQEQTTDEVVSEMERKKTFYSQLTREYERKQASCCGCF